MILPTSLLLSIWLGKIFSLVVSIGGVSLASSEPATSSVNTPIVNLGELLRVEMSFWPATKLKLYFATKSWLPTRFSSFLFGIIYLHTFKLLCAKVQNRRYLHCIDIDLILRFDDNLPRLVLEMPQKMTSR